MRYIIVIFSLVYASCTSNDKTGVKQTGRDTDYSFGPMKDTIPVNQPISSKDLEVFGDIQLGQHFNETISKLGQPASRSNPIEWEADGLFHEDWDYKTKGMVINMSSEPVKMESTREIFSITAKAPCVFKTTRHIGIGSSYADVREAYKGSIDESTSDSTLITVGTVYGGILFSFKDAKVETIFLGAAAE